MHHICVSELRVKRNITHSCGDHDPSFWMLPGQEDKDDQHRLAMNDHVYLNDV